MELELAAARNDTAQGGGTSANWSPECHRWARVRVRVLQQQLPALLRAHVRPAQLDDVIIITRAPDVTVT